MLYLNSPKQDFKRDAHRIDLLFKFIVQLKLHHESTPAFGEHFDVLHNLICAGFKPGNY